MKVELLLKGIRMTREALEKDRDRVNQELKELRKQCPHTNATRKFRSNTGNYDPSADSEWYEYDCPDCGERWSEDIK